MKTTNRLAKEKSPYLLQHAYNPVDWFPWCDEAFEKARKEDKPVFLSIGYSTCHWCHVMEKESFEDEEVAQLMNDAFISIKIDREERPDIDGIYMSVCQMLTGSGGWPLTIVMTPDKKPFFAGTYFPKGNRYGRSGMVELIPRLKQVWIERRDDVLKSANEISSALAESSSAKSDEAVDKNILDRAFRELSRRFDKVHGGFNTAPKFPTPHNFYFLLRYWKRTQNKNALQMVEKSLTGLRNGGIYDHVGFGFHRYSTDAEWLVPHFEKMLYDQALLSSAYTEAYLAAKNFLFRKTSEEILEYVLRDMTSPEGAFYSAEDADSEGVEGKFYLWNVKELNEILGQDAGLIISIFNVDKNGNFIDPVHGSNDGSNILHLNKIAGELADEMNISEDELQMKIAKSRELLFKYRERRIHPYKDDKVLTDWNGLMISALAKAAQAFNEPKYSDAAEKAAGFILNNLVTENGRLLHRFRDGEAGLPAHIDDYAFFIASLIDLYEATFNTAYLREAKRLTAILIEHFWDNKNHAFFFTADDSEELITRQKEIYDGAIPSGNSVSMLNLIRLSRITGDASLEAKAIQIGNAFADQFNKTPSAFSFALTALEFLPGESFEIIIAGEKNSPLTKEILKYVRENFIPNKIVLLKEDDNKILDEIAGYAKNYKSIQGKTAAYVCRNFTCSLPVISMDKLREILPI